jgi:pimeloyl-ACP methyl ester carboxylesterase
MARVDLLAVSQVAADVRYGRVSPALPPLNAFRSVGVGHSMGAMIVTLQQAGAAVYDAVALLCFTTRGLPEVLSEEERAVAAQPARGAADYARLAQARFGEPFPQIVQPARGESAAVAALARVQGRLAAVCAMQSMLPGNVAAEAAALTVPVLLAAGDRDLAGPPHDIPAAFTGSNDVRLVVVPRCGHHPFVVAGAARLYACLANWLSGAAAA